MAEVARRTGEILQPWAIAVGVEGTSMFLVDYGLREAKKQKFFVSIKKTLKNWTEPVLAIGISFGAIALAYAEMPDTAVRAVRVIGSWGVYKALLRLVNVEPYVMVTDASTIEAWGLDTSKPVELYVDATKVTVNVTTDSKGYVKITLPSALTEGTHQVMIHTGFRSAFSEEYVA